jgi:phosphoribosyl-ATP pyrophosphohydrolase
MTQTLGKALDMLLQDVDQKSGDDPAKSYTATLLAGGRGHCAKKVGEEGVELALAIASGNAVETAKEAADLLYHLAVGLKAAGVSGGDVAAVLAARRGISGLDEKASRG